MILQRFRYNNKPVLPLNDLQLVVKNKIENKITTGLYVFEKALCCICKEDDFEALSEKDRYGLHCSLMICKNCGLIQQNPRMSQGSLNQFYQSDYFKLRFGKDYPAGRNFSLLYNKGRKIYDYIQNSLDFDIVNLKIFEIGCATGAILKYFQDKGNEVFGIDLNKDYINFGKKNYGLNLEVADAEDIDMPWIPDFVICSNLLEHLYNPLEMIEKLRTLIGDSAYIYIRTPGLKSIEIRCGRDFLHHIQIGHFYEFTLQTLENLMKEAGYQLIRGEEIPLIQSIFKKEPDMPCCSGYNYKNCYYEVTEFLQRMERQRFFPTPYKIAFYGKKYLIKLLRIFARHL